MREEDRRLHVACGYDVDSRSYVKPDADAVRRALASGVDINCRDRTGTSALGHAAWHGDEDVLTLLLEADADVEAENIDGASPLQMTVFNNKPMATALLLVYGADAGEAVEDAESMGKAEVIAVFRAWENDAHHMLLKRASQRIMTLRQKCLKQAAASPPLLVNIDHLETTLRKAVDAGVPGQLTSAARAKLNLAEREQGREKLACLSELSLLEMDIGSLGSTLRRAARAGLPVDGQAISKLWHAVAHQTMAMEGTHCDFVFLDADQLRGNTEKHFLSFQELREQHPEWLQIHNISFERVCRGEYVMQFAAISHRWESAEGPDPTGEQYAVLRAFLKERPAIKWVWCDFCSLAQGEIGPDEHRERGYVLPNIHLLFLGVSVLALVDSQYLGRVWTTYEAWLSVQSLTPHGLKPQTHAISGPEYMRCSVRCVHGAADSVRETFLAKGLNTKAEMLAQLGSDSLKLTVEHDRCVAINDTHYSVTQSSPSPITQPSPSLVLSEHLCTLDPLLLQYHRVVRPPWAGRKDLTRLWEVSAET